MPVRYDAQIFNHGILHLTRSRFPAREDFWPFKYSDNVFSIVDEKLAKVFHHDFDLSWVLAINRNNGAS
jgi:hypothetical protein